MNQRVQRLGRDGKIRAALYFSSRFFIAQKPQD
jgi:hypothetical protein